MSGLRVVLPWAAVGALLVFSLHLFLENSRLSETAPPTPDEPERIASTAPVPPPIRPVRAVAPATAPARISQLALLIDQLETAASTIDVLRVIGPLALEGEAALTTLHGLLKHDRDRVSQAAADAIARIGGPRAVSILTEQLRSDEWNQRYAGAMALALMETDDSIATLIEHLTSSKRIQARWVVAEALGATAHPDAIGALIQALHEGTGRLPGRAAGALAASAQGRRALQEALKAPNNPLAVRRAALTALAASDVPPPHDLFADLIADPSSPLRSTAIEALGSVKTRASVRTLAGLLVGGSSHDRERAAAALSTMDTPAAGAALLASLSTAGPSHRSQLGYRLAAMSAPNVTAALPGLVRGEDPELARAVASTLSWRRPWLLAQVDPMDAPESVRRQDSRRGLDLATAAMSGSDKAFKVAAVEALGESHSEEARALLVTALDDKDDEIAGAALTAFGDLSSVPDAARGRFLDRLADGRLPPGMTYHLSNSSGTPELRDVLVSALTSKNLRDQSAVTSALSNMQIPGTTRALQAAMEDPSFDPNLRRTALDTIAGAGEPEATAVLSELAMGGDVDAMGALTSLPDGEGVPTLEALMNSSDKDVAEAAWSSVTITQGEAAIAVMAEVARDGSDRALEAINGLMGRNEDSATSTLLAVAWEDGPATHRAAAISALSHTTKTDELMAVARHGLSDEDNGVRMAALEALMYQDSDDAGALMATVLTGDGDDHLRRRAAQLIIDRGGALYETHQATIDELLDVPDEVEPFLIY